MLYLLVALAIFGHWAICIYTINRLHATALPHEFMKVVDLLWYVFLFGIPLTVIGALFVVPEWSWLAAHPTWRILGLIYAIVCWAAVPMALGAWIRHLTQAGVTSRLESNHTTHINTVEQLGRVPSGELATSLLARLPANQVFELWIHDKTLRLSRLPPSLDGLTITHLSDLHFTGRVTQDFYELIIDRANQLQSDMIVITGDIIDKPECFSWLSAVLGKLTAPHGVFFVLGNHDLRIRNELGLRTELINHGLIDLGGRFETIHVNECPILLAGNELPWFAPAADMSTAPVGLPSGRPFRIAVAHSPDQYPWARDYDFDLMLAGHTHGGQIRFPIVGPVFSPSHFGVRYSAGTFYESPTLMHVSRGLSGTRPLRFDCPPELVLSTPARYAGLITVRGNAACFGRIIDDARSRSSIAARGAQYPAWRLCAC